MQSALIHHGGRVKREGGYCILLKGHQQERKRKQNEQTYERKFEDFTSLRNKFTFVFAFT